MPVIILSTLQITNISAFGAINMARLPFMSILWLYKCHSHIQYKFTSKPQLKACGAGSSGRIFQNCHSENCKFSQSGPRVWECLWKAFEVLGAMCYRTALAHNSGNQLWHSGSFSLSHSLTLSSLRFNDMGN